MSAAAYDVTVLVLKDELAKQTAEREQLAAVLTNVTTEDLDRMDALDASNKRSISEKNSAIQTAKDADAASEHR
jgi:hypothetical protein